MSKRALCVGSIAFDYICEIYPTLREEIPLVDGKIKSLNLSIVSKDPIVLRGGTAGNIAFGIGFLGAPASIFSAVGHDFHAEYGKLLDSLGVDVLVETYYDKFTAHSYQIMDKNKEQIIMWQPNAADFLEEISLKSIDDKLKDIAVANFSPGTAKSTLKHLNEM